MTAKVQVQVTFIVALPLYGTIRARDYHAVVIATRLAKNRCYAQNVFGRGSERKRPIDNSDLAL